MQLTPLSPSAVKELLAQGNALLIDVREADEFARLHIKGARSAPLSSLDGELVSLPSGMSPVFTCRSGMRTAINCDRLASLVPGEAYFLEGGLDAWARAGLPVEKDRRAPIEIMRQVQIGAGFLVLVGALLGLTVNSHWTLLPAFVGAGLIFAGVTGFCGMAKLLARAPWNRR